jgi:hypothetical protein
MSDMDKLKMPISTEDERYKKYKVIAETDPAHVQVLTLLKVDDLASEFVDHCTKPISKAHPNGNGNGGFWKWAEKNKYMITVVSLIILTVIAGGVEAAGRIWGI